jgi:SAM-dependent methyltransferase
MQEARNYNYFLERELLAFLGGARHTLDFGAGAGEFASRLARRGVRVDCVEPDARLRDVLSRSGHIAARDLEAPELRETRYSHIYTLNTLEHVEDDVSALRRLRERLQPGGRLFVYVPAFMALYTEHDRHIGHFRRYHRAELAQKLADAGFSVDRLDYVDSLGFAAWWLLKWLPGDKTRINPGMVRLYDRLAFPVSRLGDRLARHWLGKNLLAIATSESS